MKLSRLRVCKEVDQRWIHLKGRTGLTPNLLCRLGFCLSLNDPTVPDPNMYPPDSDREINRYTLTGEWDMLFICMLKERCIHDGIDLEQHLEDQFRAHVNRGVLILFNRLKNISEVSRLLPKQIESDA